MAIYSQVLTAHAWKRLAMSYWWISDTTIQFFDPNFQTKYEISAIRGHFQWMKL